MKAIKSERREKYFQYVWYRHEIIGLLINYEDMDHCDRFEIVLEAERINILILMLLPVEAFNESE